MKDDIAMDDVIGSTLFGITLEEAESIAKNIPRTRFCVSIQTSGGSGFSCAPTTIESVREFALKWPLKQRLHGNSMMILPIFPGG